MRVQGAYDFGPSASGDTGTNVANYQVSYSADGTLLGSGPMTRGGGEVFTQSSSYAFFASARSRSALESYHLFFINGGGQIYLTGLTTYEVHQATAPTDGLICAVGSYQPTVFGDPQGVVGCYTKRPNHNYYWDKLWHLDTNRMYFHFHGRITSGSADTIVVLDSHRSARVLKSQTGEVLKTLSWVETVMPLVSHKEANSFFVLRGQAPDCSGIRAEYYSGSLSNTGEMRWSSCVIGAPTNPTPIGLSEADRSLWFWRALPSGERELYRLAE